MHVTVIDKNETGLIIKIDGRVDTTNAEHFYNSVKQLRTEWPEGRLQMDAQELTYISSAGLRTFLKLQKDEKEKILIYGLSLEVKETFDVTGFSDLFDVEKRFRKISVDGCKLIGQGANGKVYQLTRDSIVKVYLPGADLAEIKRERDFAQKSFLKGFPTAITFDVVEVDGCKGVVFELVNPVSLAEVIKTDVENFEKYADQYVALYKQIHNTTAEPGEFPAVKDIYMDYIDGCRDWYTEEELDKLRALVASVPDRNTMLHGDYHVRNIMMQEGELVVIDMGDVSIGHPVFDFLATAATQANLVDLNPAYAEIHTGMPVEFIKRLWNYLLNRYFEGSSQEEIEYIDKIVRLFSKLKVAVAPVVGRGAPREVIEASVADAKQNLLPRIDELINFKSW